LSLLTRDRWLEAHSYLQGVASFCDQVEAAAAGLGSPSPAIPVWDDYSADFREGVPLLRSANAAPELEPAGGMVASLVATLASRHLEGPLEVDAAALDADLRREGHAGRRIVDWLLGDDSYAPSSPGLLRYLGWTVVRRYLSPVAEAFDRWRDDERWLRRYCPMCGSSPAMAQLVGADPGRRRLLSCGCCGTRWQYKRTGCPFCEEDSQKLAALTVEGEGGLRIDHCESCGGYLKTYDGQGNETLLLSDWTSLHLDLIARDRGLKRMAASLYELEPAPVPSS